MKPSDYNLDFTGSDLGSEVERVMKNIMIMLKNQGDEIKIFTWAGYKNFCSHVVTDGEKEVIDLSVSGGNYHNRMGGQSYISSGIIEKISKMGEDKDIYMFTEKFLKAIEPFKKK